MKRKFLNFPVQPRKMLLPKSNRRMRFDVRVSRHARAYKSDGDKEDGEADPELKALGEIKTQMETFKGTLGDKADKAQFEALEKKINDLAENLKTWEGSQISKAIEDINAANVSIIKQIGELQEEQAREKESVKGGKKNMKAVVNTVDIEKFIKDTFGKDVKEVHKGDKKTKSDASIEININKGAENFSYATFFEGGPDTDTSAFTGRFVDPELYQRRRKRNLILDNFDIRVINVPTLVYLIKVEDGDDAGSSSGDSGGADWIVSGAPKPKRSFRVTTGKVEAKKVAIFGTVEDELLQDVASLERWIREDFMDEMREEINDGLLNNNPAVNPDAPLGLKTNAILYTPTPAYANKFTANSTNYIDQIFAVLARMAYNREEAGRVFVASDVWYQIQHLKDNDGRYQNSNLVYTNNSGQLFIGGVPIIMADEEDIPGTHVLVVGRDLGFKMYAMGPMVFERGLNADDFQHDRTSYRGYQRFLSFIPEHRENSVLYDTWANIKAAIEA